MRSIHTHIHQHGTVGDVPLDGIIMLHTWSTPITNSDSSLTHSLTHQSKSTQVLSVSQQYIGFKTILVIGVYPCSHSTLHPRPLCTVDIDHSAHQIVTTMSATPDSLHGLVSLHLKLWISWRERENNTNEGFIPVH